MARVEIIAFVIGVVLMVVGLAVSIALHELGHLWPAKKFGVRVGQYMIGFGPTLWSRRTRRDRVRLQGDPARRLHLDGRHVPAVPARRAASRHRVGRAGGGFFATMVQDARAANDETLHGDDDDRVFYRLPVWKRIVIMLGGPVMNLLFAIVLFAILLSRHRRADRDDDGRRLSASASSRRRRSHRVRRIRPDRPGRSGGHRSPATSIVSVDGSRSSTFAEAIRHHPLSRPASS